MDRSRKRASDAMNARKMTGWPPKKRSEMFKISFVKVILGQYFGRSIRLIEAYVA